MSHPSVPREEALSKLLNLEALWIEVCEEMTNPKFKNRSHHNRKTYNVGCRGPLCRKSARDYAGRRTSSQRFEFTYTNPVLMIFMSEAASRIAQHESETLEKVISQDSEVEIQ